MFKKLMISSIVAISLLSAPLQMSAAAMENEISVYLDGEKLQFDVYPRRINGSTLVPMRTIFEKLGASIAWDNSNLSIKAKKGDQSIYLVIGKKEATINGVSLKLSQAPVMIDNVTYVPLRFISESMGTTVGWLSKNKTVTISSIPLEKVKVTRVKDGDTFIGRYTDGTIAGKQAVFRLIGVDTPETLNGPVQFYGPEASKYTKEQLTGKTVYISRDQTDDPYGRVLAYVYLEDGIFFNAALVSNGFARSMAIEPNTRWEELFDQLESRAKEENKGMWLQKDSPKSIIDPFKNYVENKGKELGIVQGEFHPEQLITKEQLLKSLLIVLFPETKAVLLAKSFYDLSQDEQFKEILKYAINAGLVLKDEIVHSNEPVTSAEAASILKRALSLDSMKQGTTLSDFGIYSLHTNANEKLTYTDAMLLMEKTKNAYLPIKDYIYHLKEAAKETELIDQLSLTLSDRVMAEKISSFANHMSLSSLTDADELTILKSGAADILKAVTKDIKTNWKDILNLTKLKKAIESANDNLDKADRALREALDVN
ncbi:stalk domain-containing protein [Paenibacillus taichungensis]|uniref:stalk domain-containing protein n=1 Tax=Paenibacillus taichungensis TaxID=484184 RepID=UPI0038D17E6F